MAAAKKKNRSTLWYDGETPFEDLGATEQIAHTIADRFRDLTPSVERIMSADLTAPQRYRAVSLFEASLGETGDPHRDPRQAIETARATTD